MKLNFFSPLPPVESRVADYLWQMLPALAELVDVTLWTNQAEWEPRIERYADVRRFPMEAGFWPEVNRADMTVYHLGNNAELHADIWQLSRHHAGVVVLHDFCLHDLVAKVYLHYHDKREAYRNVMRQCYGEAGRRAAERIIDSGNLNAGDRMRFPLSLFVLETALGVMVHSQDDFEALAAQGNWPIAQATFPFHARERREIGAPRTPKAHRGAAPRRYAELLVELASKAIEFRPRAAALRIAKQAGDEIGLWTDRRLRRALAKTANEALLSLFEPAQSESDSSGPAARPRDV